MKDIVLLMIQSENNSLEDEPMSVLSVWSRSCILVLKLSKSWNGGELILTHHRETLLSDKDQASVFDPDLSPNKHVGSEVTR